jgi:hypothetical protein
MANKARKTQKGRNGEGDSVTVYFDPADPAERKALEAARLLAAKHGRRKQAIIALLEAVYTCYEQTGELMSATTISAALMGQGAAMERAGVGLENALTPMPNLQSAATNKHLPRPKRHIRNQAEVTSTAGKASAETVAKNFLSSMKGLASGFFD